MASAACWLLELESVGRLCVTRTPAGRALNIESSTRLTRSGRTVLNTQLDFNQPGGLSVLRDLDVVRCDPRGCLR